MREWQEEGCRSTCGDRVVEGGSRRGSAAPSSLSLSVSGLAPRSRLNPAQNLALSSPHSIHTRNLHTFTYDLAHSLDPSQPTRGAKRRPAAQNTEEQHSSRACLCLFLSVLSLPALRGLRDTQTQTHTRAQCSASTAPRFGSRRCVSIGRTRRERRPVVVEERDSARRRPWRSILAPSSAARSPSIPSRHDPNHAPHQTGAPHGAGAGAQASRPGEW
jgi:hypothetical protein